MRLHPRLSFGRHHLKLLAMLGVVVVACLVPADRALASPAGEPPDFSACDGLQGEERGACIARLDPRCSYAQGEDLELCKAHVCGPLGSGPQNYICREFVERRGEAAGPGTSFDCAERPPLWNAVWAPIWDSPIDQIEEFLEGFGLQTPKRKVVVPSRPAGQLGGFHDTWLEELRENGQCYLGDHYPQVCNEEGDTSSAEEYQRPEQEPGVIPDPCVATFRASQYDINYSVGGFVNPEDRLFGSLSNLFFGLGKGALQLAFVATDYAVDFDLVQKLGTPVRNAREAYEAQIAGPFKIKDIAWLLFVVYVALLVVTGKFAAAGAEFVVSFLMLTLFTLVMQGPGGPDAYMVGASDTIHRASTAVLMAGCDDQQAQGCERDVLRTIQSELHQLFIHEPYKYINWNWNDDFEAQCEDKMNFIIATGPHGTEDWPREFMKRGRAAGGPCEEAATWNADATPDRMVQSLLAGSIAVAIAVVLTAMALTVVLGKLVVAMLFVVAPLAFAGAVLPGQARRLASSWLTTLVQAIVVAIGMCLILTLLMVGLRELVAIPVDENLTLLERWFIIFALIIMIWFARKRFLTAARSLATSVNDRLARPGLPAGGGGFGGGGLSDPRAGSMFGATRMSAGEAFGLAAQGITAASTSAALAFRPIGMAGRTLQGIYGRRATARLAFKNLKRMDTLRRYRDRLEKVGSGGGGGGGGHGGGGGGPSGGPFGHPPMPPGVPRGPIPRQPGPRSARRPRPVPGTPTPHVGGQPGVPTTGPVRGGADRIREMQEVRSRRDGGFFERRWNRRHELDASGRPDDRQAGWAMRRMESRWGRRQAARPANQQPGWAINRMERRWGARQAARPANRQPGWRPTRREDLHDINLRYEAMRRDAGARPKGERREALGEARRWRRQQLRGFRDRWQPQESPKTFGEARNRAVTSATNTWGRVGRPRSGETSKPDPVVPRGRGGRPDSTGHVWGARGQGRVWPPPDGNGPAPSGPPSPPPKPPPAGGGSSADPQPPAGRLTYGGRHDEVLREQADANRSAAGGLHSTRQEVADHILGVDLTGAAAVRTGHHVEMHPTAPGPDSGLTRSHTPPEYKVDGKYTMHQPVGNKDLATTVADAHRVMDTRQTESVVVDITGSSVRAADLRRTFAADPPSGHAVWVRNGGEFVSVWSRSPGGGGPTGPPTGGDRPSGGRGPTQEPRRLRPGEELTLGRLQQRFGDRRFTPSQHEGAEVVDDQGRSYDFLGDPKASQFWNPQKFFGSIDHHLRKSNDFTVVDLSGFAPAHATAVRGYVGALAPEAQAKIIFIDDAE